MIRFALPDDAAVNLVVFNLIGQRVATLIDGPHRAGAYALRWDSRGDGGRELASGIYFYCLRTGQQSQVRSLLLLK